jgi:Kef-type K+ transport system membrane component KefB
MPHLLLQLSVILAVARVLALLLRRLGQPAVIGEMIAGFVLGPIAFGAVAPDWHAALFPKDGLAALQGLSQLGLVLFMFIVGAELRAPDGARTRLVAAAWVGIPGVLLPSALGLAIAPVLYDGFAPAGVGAWPFALFMAAALAITAFPVMARILKDRGLTRSPVGQLALAAAAIADVLVWVLLAFVIASISAHGHAAFARAIGGLALASAVALGLMRPLLAHLLARHASDSRPGGAVLGALLIGTCAMAAATEWLGLHAVFGAFLAGLGTSAEAFTGPGVSALLLILAAAVFGKFLGAGGGARIAGLDRHSALAVGSLMNARGLMELIVLKVGLDAGVIGAGMFTLLMTMTIITTLMATPMLELSLRRKRTAAQASAAVPCD